MKCPICDAPLTSGEVCKTCGFDSSCDYEHYGSLVLSLKKSPSLAARREAWQRNAEARKTAAPKRVYYVGEDGRWYDREEPAETPPTPTPSASEPEEYAPSRLPKLLICRIAALFAVIAIIILVYAIHAWRTTETETAAANQPQVLAEEADGTICIGVYDFPSQGSSTSQTDSAEETNIDFLSEIYSSNKTGVTYANELHPQVQMGEQVMDVELVFASDMEGDFTLDENGEPADESYSIAAAYYFKEQQCAAVLCCYDSYAADFMSLLSSAGIPVLAVSTGFYDETVQTFIQQLESVFMIPSTRNYYELGSPMLQFAADELGAESVIFLCRDDENGTANDTEALEALENYALEAHLSFELIVTTESGESALTTLLEDSAISESEVICLLDNGDWDLGGVQEVLDNYNSDAKVLSFYYSWDTDSDTQLEQVYCNFVFSNTEAYYDSSNPLYPVFQGLESRCGDTLYYADIASFDAYQLLLDALSQCDDPADFDATYLQNASLSADEALTAAAHFHSDREHVYTSCCYYNNGAWRTYDFSETRG